MANPTCFCLFYTHYNLKTHPEELRARLMDGYYDDSVPPRELRQQSHDLIGRHAVQAGGRLIQ